MTNIAAILEAALAVALYLVLIGIIVETVIYAVRNRRAEAARKAHLASPAVVAAREAAAAAWQHVNATRVNGYADATAMAAYQAARRHCQRIGAY